MIILQFNVYLNYLKRKKFDFEVFERHEIGYVADGGTAIGSERHKGLIPWDDDIDFAVHEDYESKLINDVTDELCK